MPAPATSGPAPMNSRGPKRSARAPEAAREHEHRRCSSGSVANPLRAACSPPTCCRNRTRKKNRIAQPRVEGEGLHVADREFRRLNRSQPQHRSGAAPRRPRTRPNRARPPTSGTPTAGLAQPEPRLLDQREHRCRQPEARRARPEHVDSSPRASGGSRGWRRGSARGNEHERHVDHEDPAATGDRRGAPPTSGPSDSGDRPHAVQLPIAAPRSRLGEGRPRSPPASSA